MKNLTAEDISFLTNLPIEWCADVVNGLAGSTTSEIVHRSVNRFIELFESRPDKLKEILDRVNSKMLVVVDGKLKIVNCIPKFKNKIIASHCDKSKADDMSMFMHDGILYLTVDGNLHSCDHFNMATHVQIGVAVFPINRFKI